jgi:isopentenyldiphosphate isomerase
MKSTLIFLIILSFSNVLFIPNSFIFRRIKHQENIDLNIKDFFEEFNTSETIAVSSIRSFLESRGYTTNDSEIKRAVTSLMFRDKIPEYFELIDKDTGESLNIIKQRNAVHRDGDWHSAVSIFIFNQSGQLLIQERAPSVAEPNRLEVSASGHMAPGETPQESILRETSEEVGVNMSLSRLINIGGLYRFVKIGRSDVENDHFEGDAYIHYSQDPTNNLERLTLFAYIASDEEITNIMEFMGEGGCEDVASLSLIDFEDILLNMKEELGKYSSALTMYLGFPWVIDELKEHLEGG